MIYLFIKKLLCYCFLPIFGFITIFDYCSGIYFSNNRFYKLPDSKKILLLGNSHSQCSLNDSILENSVNLSSGGESYLYTFYKCKKILNANPNINILILEYSDYIFSEVMDKWTFDEEFMGYHFPLYSQIIPFYEKRRLLIKNPQPYLIAQKDALIKKFLLLYSDHNQLYNKLGWGKYQLLKKNAIKELNQKIVNNIPLSNNPSNNLDLNISYIDSIVNFTKRNNIKLIFLRSPIHPNSLRYRKNYEHELTKLYDQNYSNIEFWNYSSFFNTDVEFADYEHLNYIGSNQFSIFVNEKLKHLK